MTTILNTDELRQLIDFITVVSEAEYTITDATWESSHGVQATVTVDEGGDIGLLVGDE